MPHDFTYTDENLRELVETNNARAKEISICFAQIKGIQAVLDKGEEIIATHWCVAEGFQDEFAPITKKRRAHLEKELKEWQLHYRILTGATTPTKGQHTDERDQRLDDMTDLPGCLIASVIVLIVIAIGFALATIAIALVIARH